jgi:radical SAM superfamily enzyme YgiQ (UPF0313 family)
VKRLRVLLVEPPFYRLFKDTYGLARYPLGLGYLAAAIKRADAAEVAVYNADFIPEAEGFEVGWLTGPGYSNYLAQLDRPQGPAWDRLASVIRDFRPDVIGLSAKSANFASAGLAASLAKKIDPKIVVVIGGPHPTSTGPAVLDQPGVDAAVIGEGERTLVEFLEVLAGDGDWGQVAGLCFRRHGEPVSTPPRPLIADLDDLPFPHAIASEVLIDHHLYQKSAFGRLQAVRGCPHDCFFCGSRNIWGRRVRFRSPQNVVQELLSLKALGLTRVHFDDDTFGVSRGYLAELCAAVEAGCSGLTWGCETHVRLISDNSVARMQRAGCDTIQLGIESGDNATLRRIRKGFTIEEALRACALVKGHGLRLEVFFMIGFPDETEAALTRTRRAIEAVECDKVIYSIFTPYPGTEAFEVCRERGLVRADHDLARHHHQSPDNCFVEKISPARFRALAREIEALVDRKR